MNVDWILSPFTQYGIMAFGFLSCLGLCFSTGIKMRAERRRFAQTLESLDQNLTALSTTVDQVRRGADQPDPAPEVRGPASMQGLNLTKRAQALCMHRRGESTMTISAALESPLNEIQLLLKVQGYLEHAGSNWPAERPDSRSCAAS